MDLLLFIECLIDIRKDLYDPQPVFLKTNSKEFYPLNTNGFIQVNGRQSLELWCSNRFTLMNKQLIKVTCVNDKQFKVEGHAEPYDIGKLNCINWPAFTAERTSVECPGGRLVRVGFSIDTKRFIEQMLICFDENEDTTRYVQHRLSDISDYYAIGVERITFQPNDFFHHQNIDELYRKTKQIEVISTQLNMNASKYFDSRNLFLSRGHLAAKADFVYATMQRATFLFINAAPQWQSFNAGNWERIENSLRSYITKNQMNVICYTGTFGVATLPNIDGVETPLYLDADKNNNGLIPVPKLYFRIVIEPKTKRGIVFIGVNHPHLQMEQIHQDYVICEDVSDKITYIKWKRKNLHFGYSYVCSVEDFLKVNHYLPPLTAPGGLLI